MTDAQLKPLIATSLPLPIEDQSAKAARDFAREVLGDDLATTDSTHVDEVILIVSELVTNAIKYGDAEPAVNAPRANIYLNVEVWDRWTAVIVDDRNPSVRPSAVNGRDPDAESGRGLMLVEIFARRFRFKQRSVSKAACAVVLRSGVELTAAEEEILTREMADEALDGDGDGDGDAAAP